MRLLLPPLSALALFPACTGSIELLGTPEADASAPSDAARLPTADASSTRLYWDEPMTPTSFHIPFNQVNPSVPGYGACFGANLNQLVHAGEDRGAQAGTPVEASAAGEVVFAEWANYPGGVVVIRHDLTEAEKSALEAESGERVDFITSQYGHLGEVSVSAGDSVQLGQVVGTLLNQGANTHLHWEMRTFEQAPLCGGGIPGPGYTGVGTDARDYGYLDPTDTVVALDSVR